MWFPNLLKALKQRDDEMTQKKRPVCQMPVEDREYQVQEMPVQRMACVGNETGRSAAIGNICGKNLQNVLVCSFLYSVFFNYGSAAVM